MSWLATAVREQAVYKAIGKRQRLSRAKVLMRDLTDTRIHQSSIPATILQEKSRPLSARAKR